MSFSPPGSFRLLDHLGNVIASGGTVAEAMAPLPDSIARKALLAELRQMRSDAAEAQAAQARANESAVRAFCDGVARLSHRLDALELKHADQKRREAEAKAQREAQAVADYIDSLPDPDNPASYGEDPLTVHGPSAPEDEQQLRAITEGGKDDADNEGDLPEDLLRSVPADPGNYVLHPNPVDCK
jgi:hypothetical protein